MRLGKNPVSVGDKAGFIANALLFGYLNHAVSMYESRYASREDLDAGMKLGCRYPMGPLALLDLIGLDTAYEILETMYRQGRNRLHAPAPIIKQMVTAGPARPQDRSRLLHLPGRATVRSWSPTPRRRARSRRHGCADPVTHVGVVGSGTMATGIVEVFARAGIEVTYVTRSPDKVAQVREIVGRSMEKAVQRGRLEDTDRATAMALLHGSTALEDLAGVDLVVEAVAEDLSVKQALFENLDEICKPGAILATTTSSLPVIEIAVRDQPSDRRRRDAFLQPGAGD